MAAYIDDHRRPDRHRRTGAAVCGRRCRRRSSTSCGSSRRSAATFRPEEATLGQHRVVILGHALWQTTVRQRPGRIVGRKIALNGVPHEVVGVLPADVRVPGLGTIELWAPLPLEGAQTPPHAPTTSLEVYARLKPGVTLERARAEMDRVGALLQKDHPDTNRNHGAHVVPLADDLTQPVRAGLLMLLGAGGLRPADRLRQRREPAAGARRRRAGARWPSARRSARAADGSPDRR